MYNVVIVLRVARTILCILVLFVRSLRGVHAYAISVLVCVRADKDARAAATAAHNATRYRSASPRRRRGPLCAPRFLFPRVWWHRQQIHFCYRLARHAYISPSVRREFHFALPRLPAVSLLISTQHPVTVDDDGSTREIVQSYYYIGRKRYVIYSGPRSP